MCGIDGKGQNTGTEVAQYASFKGESADGAPGRRRGKTDGSYIKAY